MNPDTKKHLEGRVRQLLQSAARQDEDAEQHEGAMLLARERAARDRTIASDIQALLDGKPLPVGELTVKLDATEGLAAMRTAQAPGAVLLSAEAVQEYADANEILVNRLLEAFIACGGEVSTAEAKPANSQGAGGRQVQHGEPDEVSDVQMPAAVWVRHADLTAQQVLLASDTRPASGASTEHLVQVDFLDTMQRAKYNV